ncbi:hypothetical protein [Pararhodobacter sp.]|uniref:hypothetical protein n=1 Tax=Pararhodobacter sp. TaxID=2127056 RepID=UPI002FDE795D
MGQSSFVTNVHPSFERVQRHKAALAEIVKNAVTSGLEQAKEAKTEPQGGADAFDWAAMLPREDEAPARVANGDSMDPWVAMLPREDDTIPRPARTPQAGGFDWASTLPSEKDL